MIYRYLDCYPLGYLLLLLWEHSAVYLAGKSKHCRKNKDKLQDKKRKEKKIKRKSLERHFLLLHSLH
jgi:hypothetical protein